MRMSEHAVPSRGMVPRRFRMATAAAGIRPAETWRQPDARRLLQLALGAAWLIDAELQYQAFMFTKAFGQTLAATAQGNPAAIAMPITWSARIIEAHPGPVNAAFATIQLLLGLGIVWRPTVKAALAASVVWSVSVWWLGEGLGGVLAGTASPLNGAPGAVVLYALLAVLLWPARPGAEAPFEAASAVGAWVARALWLVLWGSLAWFAVGPAASRSAQGLHDMISGMAAGEPGWLAAVNNGAAGLVAGRGLAVSVVLAVVLAVIAAGIYAPRPAARVAVIGAFVVAAVIWLAGEDLGEVFTGSATDLNSGLLLMLLAAAYWPGTRAGTPAPVPAPSPGQRPASPEGS
jgi:hypothetical protein